ncbi:MAG TPA: hypothetical protein VFQ22_06140 [Longimicrobiales bacterium]|nr:hypothetical protein [Longimicrobiales bacterium]
MTLSLVLGVGGAVAALALGIFLGLPGKFEQTQEDIERLIASGGGERRRRHQLLSPVGFFKRGKSPLRLRMTRRTFHIESPDEAARPPVRPQVRLSRRDG